MSDKNHPFASQFLPGAPVSERGFIDCSPKAEFAYGGSKSMGGSLGIIALAILLPTAALVIKMAPLLLVWLAASGKSTDQTQGKESENPDSSQQGGGGSAGDQGSNADGNRQSSRSRESTADPVYTAYLAVLKSKVLHHWHPTPEQAMQKIVVRFKVLADGKVTDMQVVRSSDDEELDALALKAVEDASPLPSLPKGGLKSLEVEFAFDNSAARHHKRL
jgi:TonB family protein